MDWWRAQRRVYWIEPRPRTSTSQKYQRAKEFQSLFLFLPRAKYASRNGMSTTPIVLPSAPPTSYRPPCIHSESPTKRVENATRNQDHNVTGAKEAFSTLTSYSKAFLHVLVRLDMLPLWLYWRRLAKLLLGAENDWSISRLRGIALKVWSASSQERVRGETSLYSVLPKFVKWSHTPQMSIITDLFSRQGKRPPEAFVYGSIPPILRVQVAHIWRDAMRRAIGKIQTITLPPNGRSLHRCNAV